MTTRTRSSNYKFSIKNDAEGLQKLKNFRAAVAELNVAYKESGRAVRYRAEANGRLGKNSPFAPFYRERNKRFYKNAYQRIPVKHAATFDVYLRLVY